MLIIAFPVRPIIPVGCQEFKGAIEISKECREAALQLGAAGCLLQKLPY